MTKRRDDMSIDATRPRRLVAGDDLAVVAGQLGRRPHAMSRVVRRCPHGFPAVVETLPYDAAGRPFPTLFYATCPTLVAAVGAVESAGGVRRYQERASGDAELARALATAAGYARRRRRALVRRYALPMRDGGASLAAGVGGVAPAGGGGHPREGSGRRAHAGGGRRAHAGTAPRHPGALKCLHAHAAHALARPGYLVGEEVLAEAAATGELWCADRRCTVWAAGEGGSRAKSAARA